MAENDKVKLTASKKKLDAKGRSQHEYNNNIKSYSQKDDNMNIFYLLTAC